MATEDHRLSSLREKLVKDGIKLWLPPYTKEDGSLGTYDDLIEKYHIEFGYSKNDLIQLLEDLRKHAVENLAARTKYRESGLARLRIKVAFARQQQQNSNVNQKNVLIEIALSSTGRELKEKIAEHIGVNVNHLKLITAGCVIHESKLLSDQSIKPFSQVMALIVEDPVKAIEREEQENLLQSIRNDTELLASVDSDDPKNEYYLQVADQSGKILNLPQQERKALSLAMTLNEKGRTSMRKKEYANALVFLLEADREFQQCTSQLLASVDNYALLCLDIAWCYLCLNSVNQFPDAEARLKKCETCFHKSYGTNLERLVVLKGVTGNEAPLFARLHLLQGIVAYHRNQMDLARTLFARTAAELSELKVNDALLSQVLSLGYSPAEARVALRGFKGNVEQAVQYIIRRKEEKEEMKKNEKEEKKKRRRQKDLGKTANGEWLNMDYYDTLYSMGYSERNARLALQQTNNNLSLALEIIQEKQHLLNFSDADADTDADANISEESLAQMMSLGFDLEQSREALQKFFNVEEAYSYLVGNKSSSSESCSDNANSVDRKEQERQAVGRLAEDIPQYEEDHLDLTLEEEESFLKEYLALMDSHST